MNANFTLVFWVLHKIKKRGPLRYLHFWTSRGSYGIGIVLDKNNFLGHNSANFCFRTKFHNNDPPKLGQIIGVSEVNFYSKIDF